MAKRVNTKFLVGMGVGGVMLAGLACFAFWLVVIRHNSAYHERMGDKYVQEGRLMDATQEYGMAINKDRGNKAVMVKEGDVYDKMVTQDINFLGQARGYWDKALEVDPGYKPALDRVIGSISDELTLLGGTQQVRLSELHKYAEIAAQNDPSDLKARAWSQIAIIEQWLSNSPMSTRAVDDAIAALLALHEKDPSNSYPLFYVARAKLKRAREIVTAGHPEQAPAIYDEIAARYTKAAEARPKDPMAQLRAYQIFKELRVVDKRPEKTAGYDAAKAKAIAAAEASVQPDSDYFGAIEQEYANFLRDDRRPPAEIEIVYRNWLDKRPTDLAARIALAEFIGRVPGQRAEAIKLLSTPPAVDPTLHGTHAELAKWAERAALISLNSLRIDEARTLAGKDRDEQLANVDADLPKILAQSRGEDESYLKLRGKNELLHGKAVEAVKTFERARTVSGGGFDADLLLNLANAYDSTGQSGSSERVIAELSARLPDYAYARVQLAEFFLRNHQPEKAEPHVAAYEKLQPNSPEAIRLRAFLLAQQNQPEKSKEVYSQLPEKSRNDRLGKAQIALALEDKPDAQRLIGAVLKEDAGDLQAVRMMVSILAVGHREEAREVITAGLKAKPNDPFLTNLIARLNADTPAAQQKLIDETVSHVTDPLSREVQQAQVSMSRGKYDEAAHNIDAAEKINPKEPAVVNLRYQWYVLQGKFTEAAPFVERIARQSPDDPDAAMYPARLAMARGDPATALKAAVQVVGRFGEFAQSHLLLAQAQQASGQLAEAVTSYDNASNRQPSNIPALLGKATCLDALGKFEDERATLDTAARLAPANTNIRDQQLNFELRHGNPEKAVAVAQASADAAPTNPNATLVLGRACLMAARAKGANDPASKDFLAKAREVLTNGLAKFTDAPEGRAFYAPLAEASMLAGDTAAAEKVLRELVARPSEKDRPDGWLQLADLYERSNRLDDAAKAWKEGYSRSNSNVDIEVSYSQFLLRSRKYDEALAALAANAADPRIQNQRVDTLLTLDRIAEARAIVDQQLAADPNNSAALFYRGTILLRQANIAGAVADFSALRDRNPRDLAARYMLAKSLRARGDLSGAMRELQAVLQTNPGRRDARLELLDVASAFQPPNWTLFDATVQEAQADARMGTDPTWSILSARSQVSRGAYDKALQQMQQAMALAPKDASIRQEYESILLQSGDYQALLRETDKDIAAGSVSPRTYVQRGISKSKLNDKPGASQEFNEGLKLADGAKDDASASELLRSMAQAVGVDEALQVVSARQPGVERALLASNLYALKGDNAAAIKQLDDIKALNVELTPSQKFRLLQSQASLYSGTEPQKAKQAFQDLLKLAPNDVSALNNFAWLLAVDLKNPQAAKPYSTQAFDIVQRAGGVPTIGDTHAWVLTLCGGKDAAQGITILEKIVRENDRFLTARYHLGSAYLKQGRNRDAQHHLELAMQQVTQLEQDHKPVDAALKSDIQAALEEARKSGKNQANSQ